MTHRIVRGESIVEDSFSRVDAESPLPDGDVIVPLARWQAERDALLARDGRVGVWLDGEDDVRAIADDLDKVALVGLDFPTFADGRSYSHARVLRDQLGYEGELRALGDVLRDQAFYMKRVGFDAFDPTPGHSLESIVAGLTDFSVTYQAAADEARPIYRR